MMTKNTRWALLAVLSLAAGGGIAEETATAPAPELQKQIAQGSNAFAFDLYARLAEKEGNRFFSPASIHTALAMTYAGARGRTAEQMAEVLRYPSGPDGIADAYGPLLREINDVPTTTVMRREDGRMVREERPVYALVVANALWPQAGYPFHDAYIRTVEQQFGAKLARLDYRHAERAAATINRWVSDKTKEKIKDLVPPEALQGPIRLVLTNAVYFKSNWAEQFSERATRDEKFHVAPGENVDTPMMHQQDRFGYAENDDVQILRLPYLRDALAMYVVLPRQRHGLAAVEKELSAETFETWRQSLERTMVKVALPRWEFSDDCSPAGMLAEMGMPLAFDPQGADFSGMTDAEKLFISSILHKAYVAVDEEGTEAAAATAIAMEATAMPRPEEPKVFRADHPFLFAIVHEGTGEILFLGRVIRPAE